MLKKVKSVEMVETLASPPPDGNYAVISYDGSPQMTRYGFTVDRVFKWWTTIYVFKGGQCDEVASGSNAGHTLEKYEIEKIYLVGVPAYKRDELEANLAEFGLELEPEVPPSITDAGYIGSDRSAEIQ